MQLTEVLVTVSVITHKCKYKSDLSLINFVPKNARQSAIGEIFENVIT